MNCPRRSWFLLVILAVGTALVTTDRSKTVTVNEAGIRADLAAARITIALPIVNSGAATAGQVSVELLSPAGGIDASGSVQTSFSLGTHPVKVEVPLPQYRSGVKEVFDPLWDRVRYSVQAGEQQVGGTVALGAIAPDLYELRIAHPRGVSTGNTLLVRIHAANPVTRRPVPGVSVVAHLEDNRTKQSAITGAHGDAMLRFQVPADADDSITVKIAAEKNGLRRDEDVDVDVTRGVRVMLQPDKHLYQPGQTLHMRALLFDADHHSVPGEQIRLSITDPEETTVFRAAPKTNRFGIASADWEIPASLRLGNYQIHAETDDSSPYEGIGGEVVRISRYELPEFTVTAKPDRTFYLPGQDATIELSADYLFGKPVTRGTVRLVHETERHWNFAEQKWDTEEEQEIKGALDDNGHFKKTISLSDIFDELANETYRRYRDLTYAAYVTDASTGRTEQRRFTLRLSRDPIHIYVLRSEAVPGTNDLALLISTFYPDGSPARSEIQISQVEGSGGTKGEQLLAMVRANRYGLAKLDNAHLRTPASDERNTELILTATDRQGQTAIHKEDLWNLEQDRFVIRTDKSIYKPGEPIEAMIFGPASGAAIVEVATDNLTVRSQSVKLRNGKSFVVLPFDPAFKGQVTITAYSFNLHSRYSFPYGSHTVLYPADTELKVSIAVPRTSYKPGDEMLSSVRVVRDDGGPRESAVGIVVVDKAVEERIRTDEEFNGGGLGWHWFWDDEPNFGGIALRDLEKLDVSQGVPDGMDLVAEAILNTGWNSRLPEIEGDNDDVEVAYGDVLRKELAPVRDAFACVHDGSCEIPKNEAELKALLLRRGIDFPALRDSWDKPYHVSFGLSAMDRNLTITSAGPDKTFETDDDLVGLTESQNYFVPIGRMMDRGVREAHARTGGYVRDYASLRQELLRFGIDLDHVRDPWGSAYQFKFGVNQTRFTIVAQVHVPERLSSGEADLLPLWTTSIDYFQDARAQISKAFAEYYQRTGALPHSEVELSSTLAATGIDFAGLRDPWGNPYFASFHRSADYGDTVVIEYSANKLQQSSDKPVTRQLDWVLLRSAGPDGKPGTPDDFTVASFSQVISTQSGVERQPRIASGEFTGSGGAVSGTVTDPTGAVIAGSTVIAKRMNDGQESSATTDDQGRYLVKDLKPGEYEIRVQKAGFTSAVIERVPVNSSSLTEVNVRLNVGMVSQTVEVQATATALQTNATMASVTSKPSATGPQAQVKVPAFTPRVRQYFPETLYWEPSLITNRSGVAQFRVKLADTITTWKLSAFASTRDGHVGTADTEIRAFQPFFVDHDPPRVLTVGDEITLPVVVRNYTEKPEAVQVSMNPAPWFTLAATSAGTISVPAGDSSRALFPIKLNQAVTDAPNRVSAANRTTGDAVEKPITVHPDGREGSAVVSRLVRNTSSFDLDVPADAIAGSIRGELKFYPDLMTHVIESMEAGLIRPYGCAEQTISAAYPSLLLLRYGGSALKPAIQSRAQRYLRLGYDKLLNFRETSGGFSYWGHGEPDAALTAYAVRFLSESTDLVGADPEIIRQARHWLVTQQKADGSWPVKYGRAEATTSYIARVLATIAGPPDTPKAEKETEKKTVERALAWLASREQNAADPYVLASLALTEIASSAPNDAQAAIARLRGMAHTQDAGTYWNLETNTPFYGWGTAGRIETTALVMQAVEAVDAFSKTNSDQDLLDRALLFLLANKDRYGIWYSGQATVNVLEAMLHALNSTTASSGQQLIASVNGKPAPAFRASDGTGLLLSDLTALLHPGKNYVEIRGASVSPASVQAVASYYDPWPREAEEDREALRTGDSDALKLAVKFSQINTAVGERVECDVHAERIGYRGYGMLLAEVGLPPGADVDRSSLDHAAQQAGWGLEQYGVLPDRVILYLWPRAGGTNVKFNFKPRFEMRARSSESVLYDYYNPEAQVTVAPATFLVKAVQTESKTAAAVR